MLELVFFQGSNRGKVVPLTFQKAWFGRQPTCDFVLDGDDISRVHFGIVKRGIYNVLIDDTSTNGTFVNRVLAKEVTLCAGDQINAGTHVILVREASAAQLGFRFVAEWKAGEGGVQVFQRNTIMLGRQNICQVQLNEPSVAAVHAELEHRTEGIWITDQSSGAGVYVNDQRVVRQQLHDGDRIRISPFEITIQLSDEMCVLGVEQAKDEGTARHKLPEMYRDVVKVPEPRAGEAKPSAVIAGLPIWMQDKAPIWVPTSDIKPNRFRSWALVVALLAVLGCAAAAWGARWHAFYSPGPLSKFHAAGTEQFAQMVDAFQVHSQCAACHPGFAGVPKDACQKCHADVLPAKIQAAAMHERKGVACVNCHSEHRGLNVDIERNVGGGCQASGCHVTVHEKQKSVAGKSRPKLEVVIPLAVAFEAKFEAKVEGAEKTPDGSMHTKHIAVLGDCAGCHTDGDPKIKVARETMRMRCLGCHGFGPEATLRERCYSCHFEHVTATAQQALTKLQFPDTALARASIGESSDWSGLLLTLVALGSAPLLYFGAMAVNFRFEHRSASARTIASLTAPRTPASAGGTQTPERKIVASKALREFLEPKPADNQTPGGNLRPLIDLDLCVGCAACVHACPFGVLEIVGEKAIAARLNDCTGYAACAAECPTEAIQLVSGGAMQTMELPVYGPTLETNVPGLFLAGEVTGKALIKVAINQGKTVVESILKNRPAPGAGYDVIVIGAGPAGISTALAALNEGLKVLVLEQGTVGNTIRSYPRQKFVMAEPVMIPVYGPLYMEDSSKESLLERWEEIIATTGLEIQQEEKVLRVTRNAGEFLVKTPKGEYSGSRVVLAIGRRGSPRKLGLPSEDSTKVTYNLLDAEAYHGKAICVVGGGDSGIEAANGLARPDLENRVWLVHRGQNFSAAKPRNQKKIQKLMDEGRIKPFFNAAVIEIGDRSIKVKSSETVEEIENDFLFVMVGGENPKKFLSDCGIEFSERSLS